MAKPAQAPAASTLPIATGSPRANEADRQPGDPLLVGRVLRIKHDRGFAFVSVEGTPQEYFLHCSGWGDSLPFTELLEGTRVEFVPTSTVKGLRAVAARRVG